MLLSYLAYEITFLKKGPWSPYDHTQIIYNFIDFTRRRPDLHGFGSGAPARTRPNVDAMRRSKSDKI
jgi:hypothetical protein